MPATPDAGVVDEVPPGFDDAADQQTSAEIADARADTPSAALRADKSVYLLADAGFEVLPLTGLGGAVGYLVRPRLAVEAAYDAGQQTFFALRAEDRVASLRARRFWGNSFTTNAGLAERTLAVTYAPTGPTAPASASRSELAAEASVGNLWQWSRVTFGIDWAGALLPLARLAGADAFSGVYLANETRREKSQIYDNLAGGTTYIMTKVWVGMAL